MWSTTPQIAAKLKTLAPDDFSAMVNAAFRLSHVDIDYIKELSEGIVSEVQWRESVSQFDHARVPARIVGVQDKSVASFPLKMRHADSYIAERIALVGLDYLSFLLAFGFWQADEEFEGCCTHNPPTCWAGP